MQASYRVGVNTDHDVAGASLLAQPPEPGHVLLAERLESSRRRVQATVAEARRNLEDAKAALRAAEAAVEHARMVEAFLRSVAPP
jgi:hypothetical protein